MTKEMKIIMESALDTSSKILEQNKVKTISEAGGLEEYCNQTITTSLGDMAELMGAVCVACTVANTADGMKEYYTPRKIHTSADGKVTVVFWEDGEKTIVRLSEGDTPNVQNAFTNALAKKIFGSNSQIKRTIEAKTEAQKPKKKKKHEESVSATSAPTPAESMLSHIVTYESVSPARATVIPQQEQATFF